MADIAFNARSTRNARNAAIPGIFCAAFPEFAATISMTMSK